MTRTSRFFEHLRDHTEIKLRILGKFMVPWSAKLGHKILMRGGDRLWYIDGFAGPGRYGDGSEGSPIIGARRALQVLREDRGYILGCVNVELRPKRHGTLCEVTEPYQEDGVPIHNLRGDFSESIPKIVQIVGEKDPILVFIDPFGVKPLKFEALEPLISRAGETDLVLTFHTRAVQRHVTGHPEYVDVAVGSDHWRTEWAARGVAAVLEELAQNLAEQGRFLDVARYAVRSEKAAAPKYHLILASRSYDAFELLNDFVCKEEQELDRKSYSGVVQISFLAEVNSLASARRLLEVIGEFGALHRTTTRQEIVRHVVLRFWGEWHTSEIKKAVWGLIDGGKVLRGEKGGIDTARLTFV